MNTNDLIKTAQYLDKLGSFKIADKVENKLVRLAQAGKLIVDPAIKAEITFLEKQIKNLTITEPYYTNQFYYDAPYIKNELIKIRPNDLQKRLAKIKSTEFIKDFNLKRAAFLKEKSQEYWNKNDKTSYSKAYGTATMLVENANSGAVSPFAPQSSSKGSGKPSGSGTSSGKSKPSGTRKPSAPGRAIVTIKPQSSERGISSSSGLGAKPSDPPAASSSTTTSVTPASPSEGKSSLIKLLDELDEITANENVWKANVNKVIPNLRKANSLFTEIYDSLSPQEARLLGNRIDMITLANTTFTGRFSGMR